MRPLILRDTAKRPLVRMRCSPLARTRNVTPLSEPQFTPLAPLLPLLRGRDERSSLLERWGEGLSAKAETYACSESPSPGFAPLRESDLSRKRGEIRKDPAIVSNFTSIEITAISGANVSSPRPRRNNSLAFETIFPLACRHPETFAGYQSAQQSAKAQSPGACHAERHRHQRRSPPRHHRCPGDLR